MADADIRPNSDLATRTVSALVMLAVSAFALWAGGLAWAVFVLVIGIGVWFEWSALVLAMYPAGRVRTTWRYGGAVYCGIACAVLLALRDLPMGALWVLLVVGAVIGTDIGAYAFGRTIGGPKISPSISPSKTWAGLLGGIVGATSVVLVITAYLPVSGFAGQPGLILTGALIAVLAQIGDFFQSWMKRRAGVKDSGKLLPGHGGLFDRVDGLLLVLVVIGNLILIVRVSGGA